MTRFTIQVLEGLERGTVFRDLVPPVTIGREDDNLVRLNDERVSRFHAKIQHDGERLILTDLESTNGTRVNGHPVQIRVLRIGDQVALGRCLLLIGSLEEIEALEAAERSGSHRRTEHAVDEQTVSMPADDGSDSSWSDRLAALDADDSAVERARDLFREGAPPPPRGLNAGQRAVLSDLLAYVHERIGLVVRAGREEEAEEAPVEEGPRTSVDRAAWHRLLTLQMELAVYLRTLADPGEDDD